MPINFEDFFNDIETVKQVEYPVLELKINQKLIDSFLKKLKNYNLINSKLIIITLQELRQKFLKHYIQIYQIKKTFSYDKIFEDHYGALLSFLKIYEINGNTKLVLG